eukprot:SAG31_NODE_19504_length_600_cov_0.618762_1_plen_158_part_10
MRSSLEQALPWWHGHLYLVVPPGPRQVPDWLDTQNRRIHVVEQDSLFQASGTRFGVGSASDSATAVEGVLPTFNTNAIEAQLWKLAPMMADAGPRPPPVFVHMNDDYIWLVRGRRPVPPQLLFGPSCTGLVQFLEPSVIKPPSSVERYNAMLAESGRV